MSTDLKSLIAIVLGVASFTSGYISFALHLPSTFVTVMLLPLIFAVTALTLGISVRKAGQRMSGLIAIVFAIVGLVYLAVIIFPNLWWILA